MFPRRHGFFRSIFTAGNNQHHGSLQVSFVQHFMGCQTCNELNRNGDLDACREGMQHSFDFTARYQAPMLVDARPRSEADKSQLRELPYCSNNPTAHGCMGAKPLDEERQRQVEKVVLSPALVFCPQQILLSCLNRSLRMLPRVVNGWRDIRGYDRRMWRSYNAMLGGLSLLLQLGS